MHERMLDTNLLDRHERVLTSPQPYAILLAASSATSSAACRRGRTQNVDSDRALAVRRPEHASPEGLQARRQRAGLLRCPRGRVSAVIASAGAPWLGAARVRSCPLLETYGLYHAEDMASLQRDSGC